MSGISLESDRPGPSTRHRNVYEESSSQKPEEDKENNTSASSPGSSNSNPNSNAGNSGNFDCNICLEPASDAVVSMCGHLFWLLFS